MEGSMHLREEDYVDNEYYTYNRLLYRLLGLWKYQTSIKHFIYFCFINIMLLIGVIAHIYPLATSERNIKLIVDLLETFLPVTCFLSCYYNHIFNGTNMKKILCRIKCDWDDLANKPELVILKKYAGISRLCTIVMGVLFYLYCALAILPSLSSIFRYSFGTISQRELILPIEIEYFTKTLTHYFLGIIIQYVLVVYVPFIGIGNYSMLIATIQHSCALFDIIVWKVNDRFKNCPRVLHYANGNNVLVDDNEWLVDIIKLYNKAIEFIDLMKMFYETLFLLEGFFGAIIIIIDYFYIFQALSPDLNKTEKITNITYVIGTIFIIYTCYFLGQRLINYSEDAFKAFCQIPFYSLPLKTQKMLPFFLMSSMRLCNLTVAGIKEVSHDMFASIMRSSFSFAMVFYNLK